MMPDAALRNRQAAEWSKGLTDENPITKQRKDGGLKTTNESSADNPFNTMPNSQYQMYMEQNKRRVEMDSYAKRAQNGGGKV